MRGVVPLRIPIESFVVLPNESDASRVRLVYFDPRGARHEVLIRRETIDAAMAKMDGKPRSIARSSGGLVSAQPYQLVLHHSIAEGLESPPELRVKVRFKELVRDERGEITAANVMTVTKNLLPQDILEGVSYDLAHHHKFLVDFGLGAVPVMVFSFLSDANNDCYALFTESDVIERAMRQPPGRKVPVQRYKIAKELIRVVGNQDTALRVFGQAHDTAERLRAAGQPVVPGVFKVGEPVEVPTGLTCQAVGEFLRQSAHRRNRQSLEEVTLPDYELKDEGCVSSDFLLFLEPA